MDTNLKARLDVVLDHLEDTGLRAGMAIVKELIDELALRDKQIARQKELLKADPAAGLQAIADAIREPMECGHSVQCWDSDKEICMWCDERKRLCACLMQCVGPTTKDGYVEARACVEQALEILLEEMKKDE